jgi:hypothetical protein
MRIARPPFVAGEYPRLDDRTGELVHGEKECGRCFQLTALADPDFVNELIDALHEWQFTQTRLDVCRLKWSCMCRRVLS